MFDDVESVPLWKMLREIRVRFDMPAARFDLSDLTETTLEGTIEDMCELGDLEKHPDPDKKGVYTYSRRSIPSTREIIDDVLWWYEHLLILAYQASEVQRQEGGEEEDDDE
jgi:hypothetical protein